ncbi:hypothetical protein NKH77_03630 [Streptomyces sp. M19]
MAGNLPAEKTDFIGRRRELAELRGAWSRSRLTTVSGTGGVGKTRTALRAAAAMADEFADGCGWWSCPGSRTAGCWCTPSPRRCTSPTTPPARRPGC